MTAESVEDLSWFRGLLQVESVRGIRAKEKGKGEKKRRGEAEAVFRQEWSSLRPAPRGTHTISVSFSQSPPSHISYSRAMGH